jgi:RNA polymerase sigma-70 factor (ECF subfamily)
MNEKSGTSTELSLELLRKGDKSEFARMVEIHSGVVYRLGLKMLDGEQDAEDVLQETFIKAYKALPNFDGRSSLSTWLYRIATNEALMILRKRKGKAVPVSIDEPLKLAEGEMEPLQIVDWCCMPEEELMSAEARLYLNEAVERLPDSLKVVFLLRDIEGLSTRETAEVLDLSETAVKTRLSRARLRLREYLTDYYRNRMTDSMPENGSV